MMHKHSGFTLIELSIVLVIIGLIIGGILLGRDLIAASETRAQIAQIEKYNSAVNTFANKYGGIPGDLNVPLVTQFGFTKGSSCDGSSAGKRDGNGLIDGEPSPLVMAQAYGETGLFWQDLSASGLIEGEFPNGGASPVVCCCAAPSLTTAPGANYIGDYMPVGRIGLGNFIYVYETGGANWYGLSAVTSVGTGANLYSSTTIPIIQAYNMDKKIDDGFPTTGSVRALYENSGMTGPATAPNNTFDTTSTCYNTTGAGSYSLSATTNGGSLPNCALSFRFQ